MSFQLDHLVSNKVFFSNVVATVIILVLTLVVRHFALKYLRAGQGITQESRMKWIAFVRNLTLVVALFLLFVIWGSEIRTVAFSVAAIAVAIVIGLKEVLMCMSGSFLKTSSRLFSVGDRIEINGIRGDVIDHNFFTTKLLEVGPHELTHQATGRVITIPNSVFLSSSVINETYSEEYTLHVIRIPILTTQDWPKAEDALLRACREECSGYIEETKRHLDQWGREYGLEMPSTDPRISIHVSEPGKLDLIARVPVLTRAKGKTERAVIRKFLQYCPMEILSYVQGQNPHGPMDNAQH